MHSQKRQGGVGHGIDQPAEELATVGGQAQVGAAEGHDPKLPALPGGGRQVCAGCQLIGPEFSSGTLQLILSKPVGRSAYLTGRVAGVVISIWVAVASILASDIVGRLIAGTPIIWRTVLWAALVSALKVLLTCSLLALFGSFTRSYVNIGIYLGGQIVLSGIYGLLSIMKNAFTGEMAAVGRLLRAHPGILEGYRAVQTNLFPDDPLIPFDRNWILLMTCNAVVAVLLACVIFSRREVPYGAD